MNKSPMTNQLLNAALRYAELGYAVFPCAPGGKKPMTRRGFKDATTNHAQIKAWWTAQPDANIGMPTERMIAIDVDGPDNPWLADDPDKTADLARCPISITPRGGRHHLFRQPDSKRLPWKNSTSRLVPNVDTRAVGGYIVVPPSVVDGKPYAWLEGYALDQPLHMLDVPPAWLEAMLDDVERQRSYDAQPPDLFTTKAAPRSAQGNAGAAVEANVGWTPPGASCANVGANSGQPQRLPWEQPKPTVADTILDHFLKDVERRAAAYLDAMPPAISGSGGHGATYAAATALVHGFGLAPDRALAMLVERYNPRCVPPWSERELRHKISDAASRTHGKPKGWLRDEQLPPIEPDPSVDLSGIMAQAKSDVAAPPALDDPGPIPEELLRVPGFVSEVMDYSLETAPYPNQVMAFCGALTLQAFLAGRKVRDPGDNRTNIYLLGLAHSAAGKDWPRKTNVRILHHVGLARCLGDRFASGEGLQDALLAQPNLLYQTDEIDGLLLSINRSQDARHESLMGTLLTLYSSANTVLPMRRKAGRPSDDSIDQPSLTIFGTAIPNHYYEALSERMLTNGFFARTIILESGKRSPGQEPKLINMPARIFETARWWAQFQPGMGNLDSLHPTPATVEHTDQARELLIACRLEADEEYSKAEDACDPVGTTVWGRVGEHVRKLALIYAVSERPESPLISAAAVSWATRFVMHQTRRMLFMAQGHVAQNEFDALCLKAVQKLQGAPGNEMSHQLLLRRMKLAAREFKDVIETLVQREEICIEKKQTTGRTGLVYRLITAGVKEGEVR